MASSYVGKVNIGSDSHLVGSTLYGTCIVSANTTRKDVDLPAFDKLITGVTVYVKFTYANGVANPTLKVGSTDAAPIKAYGSTAPGTSPSTSWNDGAIVAFTYDGANWMMSGSSASGSGGSGDLFGTCGTAAGTAKKSVELVGGVTTSASDEIPTGTTVRVKFTNTNTASSPTLEVGNWTAFAIKRYGTTAAGTTERKSWKAGQVIAFTYIDDNGTKYWEMNDYNEQASISYTTESVASNFSISGNTLSFNTATAVTGITGEYVGS